MINKLLLYILLLGLFVINPSSHVRSQPVQLPLNHWIYSFLERLELRGALPSQYYRSLPLYRTEIADLIRSADERVRSGSVTLSQTEIDLLEKAKGEMVNELEGKGVSINQKEYEHHLLRWREENSYLFFDGYFMEDAHAEKKNYQKTLKNYYHTTGGGIIRGVVVGKVGFYLDFSNTLIKGENISQENFMASRGFPITISGRNSYSSQTHAYFTYHGKWGGVMVGRDDLNWGPGYRNNLSLSTNGSVFDQVRLNFIFKRFKFTSVSGTLHSDIAQKNIAAHRIEVRITRSLLIGANETVIYGRRGWKLIYVNPIMPYHIAEAHAGDKDNNTLSADFQFQLKYSLKIYGELFIDDFSLSENWIRYYGNKFAFVIGGFYANPFKLPDTDIRIEYTRLEPYVYTHNDPINTYTNYNQILGSPLGPNSESIYVEAAHRINRPFKILGSYELRRHGKGDINTPHRYEDGTRKYFLKGTVEALHIYRGGFSYELYRDLYISLDYQHIRYSNENRIQGRNGKNNLFYMIMYFNY